MVAKMEIILVNLEDDKQTHRQSSSQINELLFTDNFQSSITIVGAGLGKELIGIIIGVIYVWLTK